MDKYQESIEQQLNTILKPVERNSEETDYDTFYHKNILVDVPKFLRHLASRANTTTFVDFYGGRDGRFDQIIGKDNWKLDNTYNYNEPYSTTMEVVATAKGGDSGTYYVGFAPHYGGDVRGNYGDFVVFSFNNFYDYYDVVSDFYYENGYDFELDGKNYHAYYDGAGEYFILSSGSEMIGDSFVPEPFDEQDFLDSAKKYIEDMQK